MGTPYDFFSPKSWPADRSVGDAARANRCSARDSDDGVEDLQPYNKEWWHFTLANEPFPDTYFDFPVE